MGKSLLGPASLKVDKQVTVEGTGFSSEQLLLLTVIVPVYNEVGSLEKILKRVKSAAFVRQIIVVDDGSIDGTASVLARLQEHPRIEALFHSKNRGKGAAIRTALQHAEGHFTIIQDADLEYDPDNYLNLIAPLLAGEADVVYGSRYLNKENSFVGRWRFDAGVRLLNAVVWSVYGVNITDEATCYKVFPTSVLRAMDLQCEKFEFCPEVTAKACRLGLRIREVPIRYSPRSIAEGKKIRMKDGVEALKTLWRYRHWKSSSSSD